MRTIVSRERFRISLISPVGSGLYRGLIRTALNSYSDLFSVLATELGEAFLSLNN